MKTKHWLPMALCCLPGVAVGVLLGVGTIFFGNGRVYSMDANSIFLLVMGLACPIGMGLMMWLMNKQMSHQPEDLSSDKQKHVGAADHLAALRGQRQLLEAEIAELSQIVELEERHEALLADSSSVPEDTPISAAG
jgi:hypothetical protein